MSPVVDVRDADRLRHVHAAVPAAAAAALAWAVAGAPATLSVRASYQRWPIAPAPASSTRITQPADRPEPPRSRTSRAGASPGW